MSNEAQGIPPFAPKQPPPASTSGGKGWMIVAVGLGCLLAISFLINLVSFSGFMSDLAGPMPATTNDRMIQEVIVRPAPTRTANKVVVIDILGMIANFGSGTGAGMVDHIKDQLKRAAKDDDVKAVILRVDSPGGEVLASDDIYQAIKQFQNDHGKPVIASMGTTAASGGYYVSAPCEWIVASELTMTGSIGVIMQGYNFRGLMDKVGVQPLTFKSGKLKDMLSSTKPLSEVSEEEKKIIQDFINETYGRFQEVVREGRGYAATVNGEDGRPLIEGWEDYADGRIISGKQAWELGFVDELGDFDAAVKRAIKKGGIKQANLVQYQRMFTFGDFFKVLGKAPDTGTTVKIDVGLNSPKIQAGQAYYLPSFLF